MTADRRPYYEERIKTHSSAIRVLQGRLGLLGLLRMAAFFAMGFAFWMAIRHSSWGLAGIGLISLAVFIGLVRVYFQARDRKALLEKLLFVAGNELGVLGDRFNQLPDGAGWLDGRSYLDDLDIFGPRSLYHLLNRTATSHGGQRLADLLREPLRGAADIGSAQAAVRVLSEQPEARALLLAKGLLTGESAGNLHQLSGWLKEPDRLSRLRWLQVFRWIMPVYNMSALIYALVSDQLAFLSAGILVSWAVTGSFLGYISKQHQLIAKKHEVLGQYAAILSVFNTMEAGDSVQLTRLRAITLPAHRSIHQLARLTGLFDQRLNFMVNIFFNSLFLYDIQCMLSLEQWKQRNSAAFPDWIDAVGAIEALSSLANFAYNNPANCWPEVIAAGAGSGVAGPIGGAAVAERSVHPLFLKAEALAHPMIPAGARVPNDCELGMHERLVLVTGSNMSGKTTFLRTIGVNLLLAQCGAPVCASQFVFTPMRLLTSLRVSDSLQEQTSYFMAELKKLQQIVHRLETGEPALVLIDEILRGTNSEDKTYGSEQFIRKLLQYRALSLFATHDLLLGNLEQGLPGQVSNYCFESIIDNGVLYFDYRLQKGVARNRNASFLMKKMEII